MRAYLLSLCMAALYLPSASAAQDRCRDTDMVIDTDDVAYFLANINKGSEKRQHCLFRSSIDTLISGLKNNNSRSEALKVVENHANTIVTHKGLASPKSIATMVAIVKNLTLSEQDINKQRSVSAYRTLR